MSYSWRITILIVVFFAMTQIASAQFLLPGPTALRAGPGLSDQPKEIGFYSLFTPLRPQKQAGPFDAITPRQRLRWVITNTIGPQPLIAGLFAAGFGTAIDRPSQYGPHWSGFDDRYNMRMTGIVTGNAMEAGIGYLFGEDPRYFSARGRPFGARLRNVIRLTFFARHEDGTYGPAYARYMAISGNNFLSNTWRVSGEANPQDALLRTAEGFAGRMAANAFEEFWPSIKLHVFHRGE